MSWRLKSQWKETMSGGKFKVEGYNFHEKLGTGTYAAVYKAKVCLKTKFKVCLTIADKIREKNMIQF